MQAATMIGMDGLLLTIRLDEALPFGEAAGWLSDEDVFRAVS